MPLSRRFNILAVFPYGLSLTTVRLSSRMASVPMPGSRPGMLLWLRTMALRLSSVTLPLETKRDSWTVWWVRSAVMSASWFPNRSYGGTEADAPGEEPELPVPPDSWQRGSCWSDACPGEGETVSASWMGLRKFYWTKWLTPCLIYIPLDSTLQKIV